MRTLIVSTLILLIFATASISAAPQEGTYYPAIEGWSTWQTYRNVEGGGVYGDGPLAIGNVIMCWQSPMPSKLFYLCPNTQVGTVDPSTDLIISSVTPNPPVTGTVEVEFQGGELEINGSLWGESATYMVDLDGATATAQLDLTDPNGPTVTMELETIGYFVDYPMFMARFTAIFVDDVADSMAGFSGSPTAVEIEVGDYTIDSESKSWGSIKSLYR